MAMLHMAVVSGCHQFDDCFSMGFVACQSSMYCAASAQAQLCRSTLDVVAHLTPAQDRIYTQIHNQASAAYRKFAIILVCGYTAAGPYMLTLVLLPARGGVFRSPALVGADGALRRYRGWCLLGTFWGLLGVFGLLGYSRMCFQPRDLSVGCYLLFTAKFE